MKKLRIYYNGRVHEIGVEEIYEGNFPSINAPKTKAETPVIPEEIKPDLDVKPTGMVESLEAPMPGRIVDVKVKVGQRINEGDTILILEAMKLENEVACESSGIVREIRFKQGDMVDAGDILAVIG